MWGENKNGDYFQKTVLPGDYVIRFNKYLYKYDDILYFNVPEGKLINLVHPINAYLARIIHKKWQCINQGIVLYCS